MTMPPLLWAASAWSMAPRKAPSCSIGEIAALVRRGGADDGDVGHDRRKIQPLLALEFDLLDDRRRLGPRSHGAALVVGVDEGVEADLGDDAWALRRRLTGHVEHDAARYVVGGNFVAAIIRQINGGSAVDGPDG